MKAVVALAIIAGTISSGCSALPKNQIYESLGALHNAAVDAGYECPEWRQEVVPIVSEMGTCTGADVFMIFKKRSDVDSALRELAHPFLIGPNWVIVSSQSLDRVQAAIGGTIVHP